MEIKWIQLDEGQIEICEGGIQNDKTLIFAHGLGSQLHQWDAQMAFFETEYHVVSFSLQGHGESWKPTADRYYTIEAYGDTLIKVLNQLDIQTCIWIGNSMGGVLGYHLMQLYPKLISHLITNGTTPELILPKSIIHLVYLMDNVLIKLMGFEGYIRFASNHATDVDTAKEELYHIMIKTAPQAVIASHILLGNYSYLDVLENTNVPITIIKNPKDKDISKYLDKYQRFIDKNDFVEIIEFKDTGHIANIEKKDAYNHLIQAILLS